MVERELVRLGQQLLGGCPVGGTGITAGDGQREVGHQRDVAHRHDPPARITIGCTVAAQLMDVEVGGV